MIISAGILSMGMPVFYILFLLVITAGRFTHKKTNTIGIFKYQLPLFIMERIQLLKLLEGAFRTKE